MEVFSIAFGIVSALVGTTTAWISVSSLREQRRISKVANNLTLLSQARTMMVEFPGLLVLHGITPDELHTLGLTAQELVYIIQSMEAGRLYFDLGKSKKVNFQEFTLFRQVFLLNPKVRLAWNAVVRDRFLGDTAYGKAVDAFYRHHLVAGNSQGGV